MARVAGPLLRRERARHRDLAAVSLPVGEAADERVRVLVAELLERLRGEDRAVAGGAVEDDRRGPVGNDAFDPRLEIAARHVDGARECGPRSHSSASRTSIQTRVRRAPAHRARRPPKSRHGSACSSSRYVVTTLLNGSRTSLHSRYRWTRMSPAARVRVLVGAAAVVAAAGVAGVVLATRQDPSQPARCKPAAAADRARSGDQPGRRGSGRASPSAGSRPRSRSSRSPRPRRRIRSSSSTTGSCSSAPATSTRRARRSEQPSRSGRDTLYEMRADEILHPQYFAPQDGLYPVFQQIRPNRLLVQGVLLQRQGHQHSAERLYLRAARQRPNDDEAQVAAAVGRFDEDNLVASFSRLGPLVKRFPRSQSVRFHLGLPARLDGAARRGGQAVHPRPAARAGNAARAAIRHLPERPRHISAERLV